MARGEKGHRRQLKRTFPDSNVRFKRRRKLWSSGRALGSQSEDRGFNPMLDGSGVKAMPRLLPTPNSGSL